MLVIHKKSILFILILSLGLLSGCGGSSGDSSSDSVITDKTGKDTTGDDSPGEATTVDDSAGEDIILDEGSGEDDIDDVIDYGVATGSASLNGGTTGGAGGNIVTVSTGTEINAALCNRASHDTPIIIHVEGIINHGNTTKQSGSCSSADDVIDLKEVKNVSIIGVGTGALFDELGIHIRSSSNIILQNLHIRNVKKSGSPTSNGGDAIGMESNVSNVWVDHVTLEASGGEDDGYDSLIDMKANTTYVTLSYSYLHDSGRGGLIGYSDGDSGNGPVTFNHNYYQNINSRTPLLRHATAHAYNNYYDGITSSGMNPRIGGRMKAENNIFENAQDPLGTFYTNSLGFWDVSGNIFSSSVTWTTEADKNHPAGPNPVSNTSFSMPYLYVLDDTLCVKELVKASAGANTGLKVSEGSCGFTTIQADPNSDVGVGTTNTGSTDGDNTDDDTGGTTPDTTTSSSTNLALAAGADGSSKASGTSYGNVRDGKLDTIWSPNGTVGRISVKAISSAFNKVRIIEAAGSEGTIGAWRLLDNDDAILASGNGVSADYITFTAITSSKLNFHIDSATSTPAIAEIEVYLATTDNDVTTDNGDSGDDVTGGTSTETEPSDSTGSTDNDDASDDTVSNGGSDNGTSLEPIVYPNVDCAELVNNNSVNWHESALQTDQEIIECLANSLGKPVGYGAKTTGGYNVAGGSKLVVITNDKPEDQILAAISSTDHNWIVFDKNDFANETALMMYRPYCAGSSLQSALGVNEATCRDPYAYCAIKGMSESSCLVEFFNSVLNDDDLPISNYMIDSNTTIDGRGANATFTFNGFKIGADSSGKSTYQSENVIITNNKFVGVGHTEDHNLDPDMIRSTGESHDIWIHQNTFDTTGDSAFDVKVGAYDISVSFNKLINVKRAALHGSSDSREINQKITTTIHNNLFVTTDEHFASSSFNTMRRVPLLRRGQTHMFNNVFYGYRKDVMSLRVGARALVQDNLFMNPKDNAKGDDLADWALSLFDDAVDDGALEIHGSYVYESDVNCTLSGEHSSLDSHSSGNVPDMFDDYNSVAQSTINANKLIVGTELRDYIIASAGKDGLTPWLSSYTEGKSHIIAAAATTSCQ